jgi:hypothetical protein
VNKDLENLIQRFINSKGESHLENLISRYLKSNDANILTVVISEDTHLIPEEIICGEKYVVHKGNLDISDEETLKSQIESALLGLVKKLKEKEWNAIYFIPSGFPELCVMSKLLIYRVTRMDSIDLIYTGGGKYAEMDFDSRTISGSI